VPLCAIGASLIEQSLSDILPERMLPIEANCIDLLNFDDPGAARAFDAKHVGSDFREAALRGGELWLFGRARIGQEARQ
jgi:hypothetical protein